MVLLFITKPPSEIALITTLPSEIALITKLPSEIALITKLPSEIALITEPFRPARLLSCHPLWPGPSVVNAEP